MERPAKYSVSVEAIKGIINHARNQERNPVVFLSFLLLAMSLLACVSQNRVFDGWPCQADNDCLTGSYCHNEDKVCRQRTKNDESDPLCNNPDGDIGSITCGNEPPEENCPTGRPSADGATCDNVDDGCDGLVDGNSVEPSFTCGIGACTRAGVMSCVAGSLQYHCTPGMPANDDATCDGVDDDCDGVADEDHVSQSTSCGVGVCAATGLKSCVDGNVQDSCNPGSPTGGDSDCNGLDDDCDGEVDEDYTPTSNTCGLGACGGNTGTLTCSDGVEMDSCDPYAGAAAVDATCDGVDDDCDGQVDDDTEGDTDGDGTSDCLDECYLDAGKTEPGACGCGVVDTCKISTNRYVQIDGQNQAICGLKADGTVSCASEMNITVPTGVEFVEVRASGDLLGSDRACGIRASNGLTECWGNTTTTPPSSAFSTLSMSDSYSCGIRIVDGFMECWHAAEATPPADVAFDALSAAWTFVCGVRSDTTLYQCWGVYTPPVSALADQVAVSSSRYGTCVLNAAGDAECSERMADVPAEKFLRVSTRGDSNWACGIRASDESLVCWGSKGAPATPTGVAFSDVVALRSGYCAIRKADGKVQCTSTASLP